MDRSHLGLVGSRESQQCDRTHTDEAETAKTKLTTYIILNILKIWAKMEGDPATFPKWSCVS